MCGRGEVKVAQKGSKLRLLRHMVYTCDSTRRTIICANLLGSNNCL